MFTCIVYFIPLNKLTVDGYGGVSYWGWCCLLRRILYLDFLGGWGRRVVASSQILVLVRRPVIASLMWAIILEVLATDTNVGGTS